MVTVAGTVATVVSDDTSVTTVSVGCGVEMLMVTGADPPTGTGVVNGMEMPGATTSSVACVELPPVAGGRVAVMVVVPRASGLTGKGALRKPAGMFTLAGTVATLGLEDVRATVTVLAVVALIVAVISVLVAWICALAGLGVSATVSGAMLMTPLTRV